MPLQATSGAASYDAFGGGAAAVPQYIEDVFSTWLYTGNGSTQTINNGIDLAGKGGLVWEKGRSSPDNHNWQDTARGTERSLFSNQTSAQTTDTGTVTSFNSNGFSLGSNPAMNDNGRTYASWTFRKQPKFFDVVTWTGDGSGDRAINHALASTPGCILLKRLDGGASDWVVYHTSLGTTKRLYLNTAEAALTQTVIPAVSSTTFTVSGDNSLNFSGLTYVAYLFAHNAGGFGLTGTDNVISCGSYTGNGSAAGPVVNLGYEPQWILVKGASSGAAYDWAIVDNMRGIPMSGDTPMLFPNTSAAEYAWQAHGVELNSTGFQITSTYSGVNGSGETYIYIAIRRGPMAVPKTGTSVFSPNFYSSTTPNPTAITTNFPVDLTINTATSGALKSVMDRLRGGTSGSINYLRTNATNAETTGSGFGISFASNTSIVDSGWWTGIAGVIYWNFRRAPGFFDEVCYTGTGVARTVAHNLAAVPELMIVKMRSGAGDWNVYQPSNKLGFLNYTNAFDTAPITYWNNTNPTASVFSLGIDGSVNQISATYVAYLFATCPGVSKVGSYTGNGTTQAIACGFTGGARFVLIKRTNATGDWYVWDTARGIVAGNDPHLSLNTTAAEVTSNDTIDTDSTGFVVNQVAATNVNVNAATYIFLAIA